MKIRNGFVSNSSSSSFIIGVKKIPTSIEEAKEVWFGDKAKSVCQEDLESLFGNLESFPINKVRLLELAKSYSEEKDEADTNEDIIIHELHSEFSWDEEYSSGRLYKDNPQQRWVESEMVKREIKKDDFRSIWPLRGEYYKLPEVNAKFVRHVEKFLDHFKEFEEFMMTEYEDGTNHGSYMEHAFSWNVYFTAKRFSHH